MTQPPDDRPTPGQWTPPPPPSSPAAGTPQSAGDQPSAQPGYQQHPGFGQAYQQQSGNSPQPSFDAGRPAPDFTAQPATQPKRRAPLIASLVAVVALAAGGAVTYVALSDSSDNGASSPKAAVQKMVGDLEKSDLVGLLDDLAPGERTALAGPIRDDIAKLKELHVLDPSANASAVSGVSFRAENLVYADKTTTVTEAVSLVQITSGTIDITGDASKLPFTDEFRKLAANTPMGTAHQHIDLADADKPVRIATQKVGGRWYPSLFYTAAASASPSVPSASDHLAAVGAGSAEDIVRDELTALLRGDVKSALEHLSPTELGVVHDYGNLILSSVPGWSDTGVQIKSLDLTTTSESDGITHVGLSKLVLSKDGQDITVSIDGTCASFGLAGTPAKKFCASDAADQFGAIIGSLCSGFSFGSSGGSGVPGCDHPVTAAQKQAIGDLFSGFTKLGIATSQTDGQWYVDPVRTAADVFGTLLSGMHDNDFFALSGLGH